MNKLRGLLIAGALALFAIIALAQHGYAASQAAANAALLEKYFAAVSAHDLPALKDVIADDYVQHDAAQGRGLAGMQAAFQRYFDLFPDFRMTLADSVITNDRVVARFEITATHDRPVQLNASAPTFPPTGKKLAWQGISIWRVADGKFIEHWGVDDLLGLVQQMRSSPAAAGK